MADPCAPGSLVMNTADARPLALPALPLFRQSDDIRPRNDDDLVLRSGKERDVPGPPGCDAPEDIFRNRQRSGDDVAERDFREVFRDVFRERIVKR